MRPCGSEGARGRDMSAAERDLVWADRVRLGAHLSAQIQEGRGTFEVVLSTYHEEAWRALVAQMIEMGGWYVSMRRLRQPPTPEGETAATTHTADVCTFHSAAAFGAPHPASPK